MTAPDQPPAPDSSTSQEPRPGRHRFAKVIAGVAVLAAAVLGAHVLGTHLRASRSAAAVSSSAAAPSAATSGTHAPLAPDGTFTTPTGAAKTIASLRGRPTMVWFVAGGCASCAASIPAVAAHLGQLAGDGVQVVTLGLYGDFSNGKPGVGQLLSFGKAAAGSTVVRPGWTWGMASEALSMAYDPSGIPDQYVLVGPGGHVRYRNSVPDSTMPQLLAAATALSGHSHTTPSTPTGVTNAGSTAATLP
jgi:hypothetical protein